MFSMGRNRAPETGAGGASGAAPSPGTDGVPARARFSIFNIGTQVIALVAGGIFLIAILALIGEARIASVANTGQAAREALESDRADVANALAALQRAASTSSGHLDSFGRAGDAIVAGRSTSAAADLAERALTDFAQSLQQLDASNRSFAVAVAKSAHLRPWDETVDNATEANFIKTSRDRLQTMLKITQDLPAGLATVVLDNQEMTAALRSGNVADARELYLTRQFPKAAALDQSLKALHRALVDFASDMTMRHTSLLRATEADMNDRFDGLHASFRLQIFLLMLVLCAGGALIAIYGLAIPLSDLTAAAARFAEGRFEVPTTVLGRRDEIGRLSRALERIRETVTTEKQGVAQVSREDREAKEAERLAFNTMEREVQALRKDRDRLEKELAERPQIEPQVSPEVSPEALEAERAAIRAEMQAEAQAQAQAQDAQHKQALDQHKQVLDQRQQELDQRKQELDKANAEIAKLKGELEKKPATVPDPAQREALTKAETEIARLKIQVERQNSNAVVEAKKNQEALAAAQAEVQRLTEEVGALRTAAPIGGADPKVLAEALDEIARLEAQVERQGASAVAREKRHQDIMDAGRAEAQRLASELHALKNAPRPPATPAVDTKALRESLNQARNDLATLRNDQVRERNVARKAAAEAQAAFEARIAKITADAQAERERLTRAAAEAAQANTAIQDELRRLASQLALEKQAREDALADAATAHARQLNELQNRLTEQQADRGQVINELINGFEAAIAGAVEAVQSTSRAVAQVSGQIGEAAQRAGAQRGDISTRIGRASASIQTASNAAEQIAVAFDELTQQLGQSVNAASGGAASARFVSEAVQALEGAANRMNEAGVVITDLAERTNVLSLNASIEAAKAGDAGKGFVVVASEIKSLANRTGRTGKEIADRIKAVSAAVGSVRSAFAGINVALGEIDSLTSRTARAVALQSTSARHIASGVHAAAEGTESINRAVGETAATIESSGRIVASAQSAAHTLDQQAQELRRQIDEFVKALRSA